MANGQHRRTRAEREAKLAEALRANLRRRKAQARGSPGDAECGDPKDAGMISREDGGTR